MCLEEGQVLLKETCFAAIEIVVAEANAFTK